MYQFVVLLNKVGGLDNQIGSKDRGYGAGHHRECGIGFLLVFFSIFIVNTSTATTIAATTNTIASDRATSTPTSAASFCVLLDLRRLDCIASR